MTTNRSLWTLLLAALLAAPLACAQQGPVPGSDPATYAQDYSGAQAANATADPAGYARSQASAEAVANQTRTAVYVACWAAYEATGMLTDPACSVFFTPPERAPRPHREDNTTQEAQEALNETVEGAGAFANTTLDALNRTVADPAEAPSQAGRIVDAAVAFANATVSLVVRTVKHIVGGAVDLVLGVVHAILHGLGLGAKGTAMASSAVADALRSVLKAATDAAGAISDATVAAVEGLVDGLGSAVSAAASGIASAAEATVDGIGAAGKATLDAAAGAAQAVGDVVGSAVDAVAHLFGGHGSRAPSKAPAPGLDKGLPTDGLVDGLRKALPL
jgi:hypothetical protein